eukprot:3372488-Amphidinium_carterae.1
MESGIPLYIARTAVSMYSAARRVLVGGAISRSFQSRNGLPPGCGLAVDFLKNGGSQLPPGVTMRKYVDDMVIKGAGTGFGPKLSDGCHATRRGLTAVNMKVHPSKTVCVGNGKVARK